jgi:ATP-dependent RNA helicase DDX5/DBP2
MQTASPRQTLLWSATWPHDVEALAAATLRRPIRIVVRGAGLRTPPGVAQKVHVIEDAAKPAQLEKLLDECFDGGRVLCFCGTRRRCDALTRALRSQGWPALGTHGHKCQLERDWVLRVCAVS